MPGALAHDAQDAFILPLLTPPAQKMLTSADDSVRHNVAFLELIAVKDPVASSKLLALANSSLYSRGKPTQRVRDAIQLIGTQLSYSVLLQAALVGAMLVQKPGADPLSVNHLRRYMLSLTVTVRQMKRSSSVDVSPSVELLAGLTALGIAGLLVHPRAEPSALAALHEAAAAGRYALHAVEPLGPWFEFSADILRDWKASADTVEGVSRLNRELLELASGQVKPESASPEAAMLACAQWLLESTASESEMERAWAELPLVKRSGLQTPELSPMALRVLVR